MHRTYFPIPFICLTGAVLLYAAIRSIRTGTIPHRSRPPTLRSTNAVSFWLIVSILFFSGIGSFVVAAYVWHNGGALTK